MPNQSRLNAGRPKKSAKIEGLAAGTAPAPGLVPTDIKDPREFLLAVMNCDKAELRVRLAAASALMPYEHAKRGEIGQRRAAMELAKEVTARFVPRRVPAAVQAAAALLPAAEQPVKANGAEQH